MRRMLSLVVGAGVVALGALFLGEYEFIGLMPFIAGPVFGLVVAESMHAVNRSRSWADALPAGALAALGLVWAGWIDSGEGVEPFPALAWWAALLALAVAVIRLRPVARP